MTIDPGLTLLAGLVLAGGPGSPASPPDTLSGPGGDVPYVAQGPLLCGGAAVAMVARHWGARGVHAADFAPLVREEEGGIRASELAAAARALGYRTRAVQGRPGRILDGVRAGIPAVVLLEDGDPDRLHYVALVGVGPDSVAFHDPNVGPDRRVSRARFDARWSPTGYWALVITPPPEAARAEARGEAPPGDAPPRPPAVAAALEHLRGDRPRRALARLDAASEEVAGTRSALRVRATAHYLAGQPDEALAAWNRLGEPPLDLLVLEGLHRVRHPAVVAHLGLRPGRLLTPATLARTARRLDHLPTVASSRVSYRPVSGGAAEVHAAVLERERWPDPRILALRAGVGVFARSASVEAGPLLGAADRWRLAGQWESGRTVVQARVRLPAPPLPGVSEVGLSWREERHLAGEPGSAPASGTTPPGDGEASEGGVAEARTAGWVESRRWISASVRVRVRLGTERWRRRGRTGSAALGALWAGPDDRVRLRGAVEGWAGEGRPFGRVRFGLRARMSGAATGVVHAEVGAVSVGAGAPRLVWPGAGVGEARRPLLRAHPLLADGRLAGPALGRHLLHASLEHRWTRGVGPLRAGVFAFADGAWVAARGPGRPGTAALAAAGVGLLAGSDDVLGRGNLAWGHDGWVFSVVVRPVDPW